jgi:hypothetical protein
MSSWILDSAPRLFDRPNLMATIENMMYIFQFLSDKFNTEEACISNSDASKNKINYSVNNSKVYFTKFCLTRI